MKMKEAFPLTRTTEVLNSNDDGKVILFIPLKKEECENFTNELKHYMTFPKKSIGRDKLDNTLEYIHGFGFKDIIAIGNTEIDTRSANLYIENVPTVINGNPRRSFKCFVNDDWKTSQSKMNLSYHDDGGCSWNCLMQKLNHPECGIIFGISPDNLKKFNIE